MEQITPLLEKLALQLGTTTQYLWGVLIKQAPISATQSLIFSILTIISTIGCILTHMHLCKNNSYATSDDSCEPFNVNITLPMIVWGVIVVICVAGMTIEFIPNMINGYFNPEYWAFREVTKLVSGR